MISAQFVIFGLCILLERSIYEAGMFFFSCRYVSNGMGGLCGWVDRRTVDGLVLAGFFSSIFLILSFSTSSSSSCSSLGDMVSIGLSLDDVPVCPPVYPLLLSPTRCITVEAKITWNNEKFDVIWRLTTIITSFFLSLSNRRPLVLVPSSVNKTTGAVRIADINMDWIIPVNETKFACLYLPHGGSLNKEIYLCREIVLYGIR